MKRGKPKNTIIFYKVSKLFFLSFVFFFGIAQTAKTQCISAFPHVEDFETAPTWTAYTAPTSSVAATSDWAWGTPNHTYVINSAGSGNKCWCVGTLTGSFYNYNQESYVLSPCYDFTNLQYPHIKFKLFYDSEYKYDGGNLQSSINGGLTWQDVGTVGGTTTNPIPEATDCNTQNWYNYPSILYLNSPTGFVTSKHGWCGNAEAGGSGWDAAHPAVNCVGGHGLGHWVTAEHCLTGLAGQPNVLLRFTFGGGYTCNDFDGFAFDSVAVSNGIINTTTITTTCGTGNTINFNSGVAACPTTTWAWNFGDAASGGSNNSGSQNPSHTFSGPGSYTVTLIASGGACNPPDTVKKVINIMTVSITSFSNAACSALGSATATVTGGISPTYSWSPLGGTSNIATGLNAGTYTVFVSDPGSCPTNTTVTITQAGQPNITIASSPASCSGPGSASATVTGGAAPYTYSWSPTGGTNAIAANLSAGNYTVTVSDTYSCTVTASVVVANTGGITATSTQTNVSCNGGNNGIATITPASGTTPYSYTWSPNGGNSATATNLSAGNYTVIISDVNSCTTTAAITVTQPSPVSLTTTSNSITCYGASTGSASVVASGGTSPYTYAWFPNNCLNATASNLTAGNYSVVVTDHNLCKDSATVNIVQPGALTIAATATATSCGQSNGIATATVNNGGTPNYTYIWLPGGENGATAINLASGNYTVMVSDANSCTVAATAIVAPSQSISVSNSTNNITCNGSNNGSASITTQGGTSPYTYSWMPTVSGGSTAINLSAASYTVLVTDNNSCSANTFFTITQPSALTVSATSTATTCGLLNGTAQAINISGGILNYTYAWLPTGGNNTIATNLAGGNYTVTVTDANSCTVTAQTTVASSTPAPLINFSENPGFGCAPVCALFSAVASPVPNDSIVSWTWDFGDGGAAVTGNNPYHCFTVSGSYNVQLTAIDQNGCKDTLLKTNVINVYPKPTADFYASPWETDIFNPTINFYDESQSNITNWNWTLFNGVTFALQNPVYTYQNTDTVPVKLVVTNASGCVDSITKNVIIIPIYTFYAPNCTTPNGDGLNEFFMPVGTGWDNNNYNLWIFDRWGNMFFHTTNPSQGWDGTRHDTKVQEDTYVWKVDLKDVFGKDHAYHGQVSVVR